MKLPSLAKWMDSDRNVLRDAWDKLEPLPGGARIFSELLGRFAPYSGSVQARVVTVRRGYAEVTLRERRAVQNHLASIHAIALVNLAEIAGNVALAYSMPRDARFIVTSIAIDYHRKARGLVRATSYCPVPTSSERKSYEVPVTIFDESSAIVCTASLTTLVGPKKHANL
jgi:uncharacterized protein (TIGR00369 family)